MTEYEHMVADMAQLFAQEGGPARDVVIDGVPLRGIAHAIEEVQGEFVGEVIHRQRYLFQAADIATSVGQERTIEDKVWQVAVVARPGILIDITFERRTA